jgi:hypothetical protein
MDIDSGIVRDTFQKAVMSRQLAIQEAVSRATRIPSAEGMLIRLMLEDQAAREEIPELLQRGDLVEEMECREIVSGLLGMIAAGMEPDLTALSDRLPEAQQRVLAEVAFLEDARPVSIREINTYVFALERRRLQRIRESLQRRIAEAQKTKNHRMAVELLRDQRELDRKLSELL